MEGAGEDFLDDDCRIATVILNAFNENDKIRVKDLGIPAEPSSWDRSVLSASVLLHPESLSGEAKQMIYTPLTEMVFANERIMRLESDAEALSFIGLFKHLSPILFGVGLGIRIARIHYEVVVEKRKAQLGL